jgi:hypothetical protein
MPTGTVRFKWQYFTETFTMGSATLNSGGGATITKSNLNADAFPLTAVYSADAANLGSTSAVLNQVVLETTSYPDFVAEPDHSRSGGDFHCKDFVAHRDPDGIGYLHVREDCARDSAP